VGGQYFLTAYLVYDEAALAARLAALEPWQKAAFALACAQRMLPIYLKYCALTGEGDAMFVQSAIATLWQAVGGRALPPHELQRLIDRAKELVPPGEAVGRVIWHYYAANAVAALIYAIECQQRDLVQDAVWAALQPFDVVTNYVESRDRLNFNSEDDKLRLERDPVVQAELQRQETDLNALVSNESQRAKIKRLREAAERFPVLDPEHPG
jgi:uncharacterized protein YjaG (DUF416 family)